MTRSVIRGCLVLMVLGLAQAQQTLYSVHGRMLWDGYGVAAVRLSDVDGDGLDDVAVSAVGRSYVEIRSGADGTLLQTLRGERGFGAALAAADVDGDGIRELIVGAPLAAGEAGAVFVYDGRGRLLLRRDGRPGDHLGHSLLALGDQDGDGREDVLVGSATSAARRLLPAGSVPDRVWPLAVVSPLVDTGVAASGPLPTVWVVGDVDGDGLRDVVRSGVAGSGLTLVPSSGAAPRVLTVEQAEASFGWAVADAGDVDADGFDDVIVGAPGADRLASDAGAAYVFSGATGSDLFVVDGQDADEHLGSAVGSLGDVNGDGLSDVFATGVEGGDESPGVGFLRVYATPRQP